MIMTNKLETEQEIQQHREWLYSQSTTFLDEVRLSYEEDIEKDNSKYPNLSLRFKLMEEEVETRMSFKKREELDPMLAFALHMALGEKGLLSYKIDEWGHELIERYDDFWMDIVRVYSHTDSPASYNDVQVCKGLVKIENPEIGDDIHQGYAVISHWSGSYADSSSYFFKDIEDARKNLIYLEQKFRVK